MERPVLHHYPGDGLIAQEDTLEIPMVKLVVILLFHVYRGLHPDVARSAGYVEEHIDSFPFLNGSFYHVGDLLAVRDVGRDHESLAPAARISPAPASSSDAVREARTTLAPARANPLARVLPIPRPAPVTMVNFPSTEKLGRLMIPHLNPFSAWSVRSSTHTAC